jgi:ABC-type multidrug transport system, ATPase component
MLKLAVLAVTLPQALDDFKQHDTDAKKQAFIQQIRDKQQLQGLSALLAQVGWVWPVSLIFEFNFKPENFAHTNRQGNFWANALFKLAVAVIREPEPSTKRRAIIDLGRVEAQDLKELIDVSESPFSVFQRLVVLHRMGLLDNLQLGVRKTDPDDILLFDELSDGEQMYLGRMALFHLLQGQDDALLLLDEPETHFNDFWKREMVGIIDDVLKDHACNVIISTHSSITLTDVFDHEIIRFQKENGESRVVPLTSTTFGADPSEIMISVFGAEDSIGERSLAWLNAQLERQWKPEEREELERIIKQIGPGLHRSELRTIWRKLSAAQN